MLLWHCFVHLRDNCQITFTSSAIALKHLVYKWSNETYFWQIFSISLFATTSNVYHRAHSLNPDPPDAGSNHGDDWLPEYHQHCSTAFGFLKRKIEWNSNKWLSFWINNMSFWKFKRLFSCYSSIALKVCNAKCN